jgi:endogenous inhibitor of DNA gyrase (YacG/DUF329 family)
LLRRTGGVICRGIVKRSSCPICKKPVEPRAENRSFPFCSVRCRQVDLGKWVSEEYRVADRPADEAEDELPTVEGGSDDESVPH